MRYGPVMVSRDEVRRIVFEVLICCDLDLSAVKNEKSCKYYTALMMFKIITNKNIINAEMC